MTVHGARPTAADPARAVRASAAREQLERELTEAAWQELVIAFAHLRGWWTYHPYDSRRSTPGWPDLTLIRGPELMFVELKKHNGKVTPEQARVLELLEDAGQEVRVWRPQDEAEMRARLSAPRPPAAAR